MKQCSCELRPTTKEDGTYDYSAENMVAVLEASGDGSAPIEVLDEKLIPSVTKELKM